VSRATLSFKLPEEQEEYKIQMQAGDMHSALWELIHGRLRSMCKHGIDQPLLDKLTENGTRSREDIVHETVEYVRDYIFEVIRDNNLDL
jgi:hypothetical protein